MRRHLTFSAYEILSFSAEGEEPTKSLTSPEKEHEEPVDNVESIVTALRKQDTSLQLKSQEHLGDDAEDFYSSLYIYMGRRMGRRRRRRGARGRPHRHGPLPPPRGLRPPEPQ